MSYPNGDQRTGPDSELPVEAQRVQIVGIGASAGGLEAFSQLLRALPPDTGLGFVLVPHLAASHASALAEILGRETAMPVVEVQGEPLVEANHVYVIPPGQGIVVREGVLHLVPRPHGVHHPIDQFFRSLAEDQRHRATGVILSGTATDGSAGLEAIKAEGGVTFAQDDSARHDGMPTSAIATGTVDFVLPPDGIALELARIARQPDLGDQLDAARKDPSIARIIHLLHDSTGLDFSQYRFNTLYRRINRRMQLQKVENVAAYARYLQGTSGEAEALQKDLLISVTSFFRDPPAFDALRESVFPALLRDRSVREPVRVWCIGCSTGQEAYSLAMAFTEYRESVGSDVPLQLFATDVNGTNIDTARTATYGSEIADDVTPERLGRFFTETDGRYRIRKEIRDSCIFSRHNVAIDPPFSRVDLITCRNLLIYLEPILQQKILPVLHYALKPGGFLWLGGSETVGSHGKLFEAVDSKQRIYSRNGGNGSAGGLFVMPSTSSRRAAFTPGGFPPPSAVPDLPKVADRLLAAKFSPPAVLVTRDMDILQFRGETEPYLASPPGKATFNLFKMLRDGLQIGTRSAVLKASTTNTAVRTGDFEVTSVTGPRTVAVEVIPIGGEGAEGGFLVVFHDSSRQVESVAAAAPATRAWRDEGHEARLEEELLATRTYMQSVIEQQEVANEELQSANEENQSANEELQSINEELETSKEEIQSSNEELATVNDELNHRNRELGRLNDDLANLMSSVEIPILMVGADFRIRRFTKSAERLLNLIPADIGRPIGDIRLNLEPAPRLEPLFLEVLDTLDVRETEVQDRRGRWYSLRVRPYRTLDNRIDGVVVMLVDIDDIKLAQAQTASIVATVREPLLVLDEALRVLTASAAFYRNFGVTPEDTVGRVLFELGNGQWDIPELRRLLLNVLPNDQEFVDFEVEHDFDQLGQRTMVVNARRLRPSAGAPPAILLAIEDRTDQRLWERRLEASESDARRHHQQLRAIYHMAPMGLGLIDRDLSFVMVNETMAAINGVPAPDHFGRQVRQVVPALADALEPVLRQVLNSGVPVTGAEVHGETAADPGAQHSWIASFYPLLDEAGAVVGVNVMAEDVTEQALMQQAVRGSELRYRRLFEAAKDGIIILDADSALITDANPCISLLLGYSREEMLGKSLWEIGVFPDAAAGEAAMRTLQETEQTRHDELSLQTRHGRQVSVEIISSVYREDDLRLIRCNVRDVTIQRIADRALLLSTHQLRDADRRKDEFLAMLAHELRNPLAPIRNALQVVRLAAGYEPNAIAATAMMERQVTQMVRLVDDLLDVSRITRGAIELRKVRVDLAEAIRQAIEAAHSLCDEGGHELTTELPEEPIQVYADPARLAQIVGNLLNNACKFTPRGGKISLALARERDSALITVADDGIGLSGDELLHVFDLFMQADTSLTRSGSGLGIGLTMVKRLTEQHKGTVGVASAGRGLGSTFVVRLPVDQRKRADAAKSVPEDPVPHSGARRVLIVDDNRDSADSLATLLQLNGHETATAYDGQLALEVAESFKADVILLDIGLPRMSGYEVARLIRGRPWGEAVMLVALTGWGQQAARDESAAAGIDAHMVKPVDFPELLMLLDASARLP